MNWLQLGSVTTALVAGLAVLIAASTVADRLGAPVGVIEYAAILLAFAGVTLSAVTTRSMRPATFRMGGGDMGWIRSVAPVVLIGCALPALPGAGVASAVSVALGLAVVAALFAAPIHRTGASGLGLFALARYRSRSLCAVAGLATLAVCGGLAALAAAGAAIRFTDAFDIAPQNALSLVVAAALVIVLPGGMASATAGAVAVLAIVVTGFVLPATTLALRPEPGIAGLESALGAALGTAAPAPLAIFGLAAVFLYLGFIVTARKPGQARQVFLWSALLVIALSTAALLVTRSTSDAGATLIGRPVDRLPPQLYAPAARGIVEICGLTPADPVALRRACAARGTETALTAADVQVRQARARWMAVALDVPAIEAAIFALALPLGLIVLLSAAARAAAAALIDEIALPLLPRAITASAQLALHRLATIAVVLVAAAMNGPLHAIPEVLLRNAGLALPAAVVLIALPAILVFPARAAADWRVPLALVGLTVAVAAAMTTGFLPAEPEVAAAAVALIAIMSAGAPWLLPNRAPYDRRAADIVAGRLREPIVTGRDA